MRSDAALPNFLIIGAAKAGSTSLYEYLRHHPQVFMSPVKEPQFFCHEELYVKGIDYYADTFFKGSAAYAARGEATPHYMYFEKVAKRIAQDLPRENQKFIVIMRDPVKRAHSLYWNMVHEGLEDLGFTDAIRNEADRPFPAEIEGSCSLQYKYISSSRYAEQIRRYLKYFDMKQFLFLFIEDLMSNPESTLTDVYRFLGLSPFEHPIASKQFNTSNAPRYNWLHAFLRKPHPIKRALGKLLTDAQKYRIAELLILLNRRKSGYDSLDAQTEQYLRRIFAEDVLDLQEITGRNLSAWLPPMTRGLDPHETRDYL